MKPQQEEPISSEKLSLIHTVADDLKSLYSGPTYRTQGDLRRLSPLLRRLLVEGDFGTAWRAVGFKSEPVIPASDLRAQAAGIPREWIEYAYAQPYVGIRAPRRSRVTVTNPNPEKPGMLVVNSGYATGQGPYLVRDPRRGAPHGVAISTEPLGKPAVAAYTLTEFKRSAAILFGSFDVTREEVIKYVANERGGVHWRKMHHMDREAMQRLEAVLLTPLQKGLSGSI